MVVLKYTILVFIFLGVSFIGNLISRKYKIRVEELKNFKEVFNILESKIKFTYEPLGEILVDISNLKENKNIDEILKNTSNGLKENSFKVAWENGIDIQKEKMCLKNDDINVIKGLGNMLRKNRCTRSDK